MAQVDRLCAEPSGCGIHTEAVGTGSGEGTNVVASAVGKVQHGAVHAVIQGLFCPAVVGKHADQCGQWSGGVSECKIVCWQRQCGQGGGIIDTLNGTLARRQPFHQDARRVGGCSTDDCIAGRIDGG